jgi:FKBP-type peptidyl-prolyl cis-trans isomerase
MKTIRELAYYGILGSLALLTFSCKNNNNSDLLNNEQRELKQYLLSHNITVQPRPSGLYYLPTDTGSGIKPQISDLVLFNFTLRLVNDQVIGTTIDSIAKMNNLYKGGLFYRPFEYRLSWWFKGLQEGFQLMREGAKATFIIPSSLAYGSAGYQTYNINGYTTVIFDIQLIKVIHDPVAYEKAAIEKYVLDSIPASLIVNISDSGVYHITEQAGTGDLPVDNKVVSVRYILKLLDGSIIQKIASSATYSFTLGTDKLIPGFEQAVRMMNKGEEAWIIIPYKQAYGEQSANLPSFSTLVYYMNIVDIQ